MRLTPHLLLLPVAVASVQIASAQDTAYQALRVIGTSKDKALLNRVVEVKGRNGAPQPTTWLVVIDDPKARGGVREIEVSKGKISSERTPVQAYSGSSADQVMDMSRLNLDSQGAFGVAEDEAKAAGVAFDAVDYVLRKDDNSGAPQWVLQLLDRNERGVGTVKVAADNGNVVSRQFRSGGRNSDRTAEAKPESDSRSARQREQSRNSEREPEVERRSTRTQRTERTESDYIPPRSATGRSSRSVSRPQAESRSSSSQGRRESSERRETRYEREEAPERTDIYDRDPSKRSDIGYRVNRRVHRMGGALQKFFTGRRTVDEEYREPYDDRGRED